MQFGSDRSAGLQCGELYQAITQPAISWRVLAIPVTSSYTCCMNYWIFQDNPDIFDIDTLDKSVQPDSETTRHHAPCGESLSATIQSYASE
jgi:hypothetical protein